MTQDYSFEGWVAKDPSSIEGNMQWEEYQPKPFGTDDIDVKISHCGVCASDMSHLQSGWKPADYPIVVGHEIVGRVVRVGKAVQGVAVGDRVGIGAQCKACLECERCKKDQEQHCSRDFVTTYDARFSDGSKAYGGYAKYWRGPAAFAFHVPEGMASEIAGPMLCGGLTVFNPLVDNKAGPGKRVAIVGIGGLGHFGVLFAKALGCDTVTAISRSFSKKEDAIKMGADNFIATGEESEWWKKYADRFDLIISTISGSGFEVDKYLNLLDVNGTMIQVGAPEDPIPAFNAFALLRKNLKLGGSLIGSRKRVREMLELASKTDLKAWIQIKPMSEANDVVVAMKTKGARYRFVLEN
jgi:alcohol dehydrogenase (NADP+)